MSKTTPAEVSVPLTVSQIKATTAAVDRIAAALATVGRLEDAKKARLHAARVRKQHVDPREAI